MVKAVVIGEPSGATMDQIMAVYPRHKAFVDTFTQDTGTFTYPTVAAFQTGVGNLFDSERAAAYGIDACYTKPMDFEVLEQIKRNV